MGLLCKPAPAAFVLLLSVLAPTPVLAQGAAAPAAAKRAVGLATLKPLSAWEKVGPGVWRGTAGDLKGEIRYTDYAAAPPRLEGLAKRRERDLPFRKETIVFGRTADGKTVLRIPLGADEKLYGFGLQLDGLEKTGRILTLNVDHWSTGGGRTHAPVPFYISSRGYGVFVNTARFLKVYAGLGNRKDAQRNPAPVDRFPATGDRRFPWTDQPRADAVEVLVDGPGAEVVVFAGESPSDVTARYNLFCGGGALPPLWGLGFWHRLPAEAGADDVRKEAASFASHDMPVDVFGLEPGWMSKSYPSTFEWQKRRFPDPKTLIAELLKKGIRLNLWENPYVSPESRLYRTLLPLSGSHLVWLGLVPDYTLPEARQALLAQHVKDHVDIGVSGYKIDEVDGYDVWLWPDQAEFPSGTPGTVMRQAYGLIMQNMIFNGLFKPRNQRTYGLVRGSNGAASGYPFVLYSDAYDIKEYITGISAASLGGLLWTPEIRDAENEQEWINRMQLVCFSALAQLNGWASKTAPWQYPAATGTVREALRQRLRFLPYLYAAFADYHFQGLPPIRAMLLEDPEIEKAEDQFMFGPSLLAAPFYDKAGWEREVVLPAGTWYDFYTGEAFQGGRKIKAANDVGRMPLYAKEGAVIPMVKDTIANTDQAYGRDLEVLFFGKTGGSFDLYEDDGRTFDCDKGKYRVRRLTVKKNAGGSFDLSESVVKDGGPALFGKTALRVMSR